MPYPSDSNRCRATTRLWTSSGGFRVEARFPARSGAFPVLGGGKGRKGAMPAARSVFGGLRRGSGSGWGLGAVLARSRVGSGERAGMVARGGAWRLARIRSGRAGRLGPGWFWRGSAVRRSGRGSHGFRRCAARLAGQGYSSAPFRAKAPGCTGAGRFRRGGIDLTGLTTLTGFSRKKFSIWKK